MWGGAQRGTCDMWGGAQMGTCDICGGVPREVREIYRGVPGEVCEIYGAGGGGGGCPERYIKYMGGGGVPREVREIYRGVTEDTESVSGIFQRLASYSASEKLMFVFPTPGMRLAKGVFCIISHL